MRDQKKPVARGFYILPNLFTTGSLFCGFFSVILAFKGQFDLAAWAILTSALLDGCDGKVARLTGTASQFGVEYDSLADDVAFGVAPGMLAYAWQLHNFGRLGLAIAFLYCACAALRLARFNVGVSTTSKRFFVGLPSPASACVMACFVLFMPYYPSVLEPILPGRYFKSACFCLNAAISTTGAARNAARSPAPYQAATPSAAAAANSRLLTILRCKK